MLEKLRDNPRAVVAALVAAGVFAIAVGAGGQSDTAGTDTEGNDVEIAQSATDSESDVDTSAEGSDTNVDPEVMLDETQEADVQDLVSAEPEQGPVDVVSEEGMLTATVRSGDNQTLIARQMVDDYLSKNSRSLSAEQRLFAESSVVDSLSRTDIVHVGEVVAVDESMVGDIVSSATQLTEAQIACWSVYL